MALHPYQLIIGLLVGSCFPWHRPLLKSKFLLRQQVQTPISAFPNDTVSFMYGFDVSPDGAWWAGEFELDNSINTLHLRGSGSDFTEVIWVEDSPAPGGLIGTIQRSQEERQISINNNGGVFGLARHRDQGMIIGEFLYGYDGQTVSLVAAENTPIPALPDAFFGTNVNFVEPFHSPNALNTTSAAFVADNITGTGVTTDNNLVTLSNNGSQFGGQRKGVTNYASHLLEDIDNGQYFVGSDNDRFLFNGRTNGPGAENNIVVVGDVGTSGQVVLQENVTPINTSNGIEPFDRASQVFLAPNGDWYASGDTTLFTDVLIRNGDVLVTEGDPSPDGFTYQGEPIAFTADGAGNHAWIWQTTNPNPDRDTILVYNGTDVLLSEGDIFSFDQNGDGSEQPALIEHLFLDERNLSLAGGHVYLMAEVDDPNTTTLIGWTFLRLPVPSGGECDFDGNALCNVEDLNLLLAEGPIVNGVPVTVGLNDQFDIKSDGLLDLQDRDEWLALAAIENGLTSSYKLGDANLDGVVDGIDFIAWNGNKFTSSLAWSDADFNGDGVVDGNDFIVWNGNKFTTSEAAHVPEPVVPTVVLVFLLRLGCSIRHNE